MSRPLHFVDCRRCTSRCTGAATHQPLNRSEKKRKGKKKRDQIDPSFSSLCCLLTPQKGLSDASLRGTVSHTNYLSTEQRVHRTKGVIFRARATTPLGSTVLFAQHYCTPCSCGARDHSHGRRHRVTNVAMNRPTGNAHTLARRQFQGHRSGGMSTSILAYRQKQQQQKMLTSICHTKRVYPVHCTINRRIDLGHPSAVVLLILVLHPIIVINNWKYYHTAVERRG